MTKNAKNGTKPMGTSDICRIIEACSINGVSRIKTAEFEIEFWPQSKDEPEPQEYSWKKDEPGFLGAKDIFENTAPQSVDKDMLEDLRLSQLMIDDPFGFEREMILAQRKGDEVEDLQDRRTE